jgi:alpha-N-acetylglucosaminidase
MLTQLLIGLSAAASPVGSSTAAVQHSAPPSAAPAYALLERALPGSSSHFTLKLSDAHASCFAIDDNGLGGIAITAGDVSLLSAGIGYYLRDRAQLTIGWPRGGGSRLTIPRPWPTMGATGGPIRRCRRVPYSYFMNVCTHSYSLVWYGWAEWEALLDWMAVSGINLFLALTGQEELQYRVLRARGVSDAEIRGWFNGPAFLTWSRGQNEYGAGIAGPLPRSFMQQQHSMQVQILRRARALGIVGQLPGFQGNVPVGLAAALADTNITKAGATGWMDSLDPHYAEIADDWMKELISSFGTDHWYQLEWVTWDPNTGGI